MVLEFLSAASSLLGGSKGSGVLEFGANLFSMLNGEDFTEYDRSIVNAWQERGNALSDMEIPQIDPREIKLLMKIAAKGDPSAAAEMEAVLPKFSSNAQQHIVSGLAKLKEIADEGVTGGMAEAFEASADELVGGLSSMEKGLGQQAKAMGGGSQRMLTNIANQYGQKAGTEGKAHYRAALSDVQKQKQQGVEQYAAGGIRAGQLDTQKAGMEQSALATFNQWYSGMLDTQNRFNAQMSQDAQARNQAAGQQTQFKQADLDMAAGQFNVNTEMRRQGMVSDALAQQTRAEEGLRDTAAIQQEGDRRNLTAVAKGIGPAADTMRDLWGSDDDDGGGVGGVVSDEEGRSSSPTSVPSPGVRNTQPIDVNPPRESTPRPQPHGGAPQDSSPEEIERRRRGRM